MQVYCGKNYYLAVRVPPTAIHNRESRGTRPPCESRAAPSSPSGETSARSTATLRAGAQLNVKSAKGVWGKTRVFPHKQHIKSIRDCPPKQSGGLFRKHTTQLNSRLINCRFTETYTQKQQWADLSSAHNFQLIATPRKKFFV